MKITLKGNEARGTEIWLDDKRLEQVLNYSLISPNAGEFVLRLDIAVTELVVDLKTEQDSCGFYHLVQ